MEAYKSTCPDCHKTYRWTGFKTGIGKSPAQLEAMHHDETVCKFCGSPNLKTDLDRESEIGQAFAASEDFIVGIIGQIIDEKAKKSG